MIRRFTSNTQKIGERGEEAAVLYLIDRGFSIVERNVPNKYGEIDIIARKSKQYYFYEVKACRQGSWFNPAENMTESKIRKFLVSVEYYCLIHRIKQYDVALIVVRLCETNIQSSEIEILSLA